jgi:hypothetical protein
VEAGRIAAVGSGVWVPEGTPVIQVEGGTITPGLIDANARVESVNLIAPSRRRTAEQEKVTATFLSGKRWLSPFLRRRRRSLGFKGTGSRTAGRARQAGRTQTM